MGCVVSLLGSAIPVVACVMAPMCVSVSPGAVFGLGIVYSGVIGYPSALLGRTELHKETC